MPNCSAWNQVATHLVLLCQRNRVPGTSYTLLFLPLGRSTLIYFSFFSSWILYRKMKCEGWMMSSVYEAGRCMYLAQGAEVNGDQSRETQVMGTHSGGARAYLMS